MQLENRQKHKDTFQQKGQTDGKEHIKGCSTPLVSWKIKIKIT